MTSTRLAGSVLWALLATGTARAEEPQQLTTTFRIDDADPERAVPSRDEAMKAPLQMGYWVMLVTERAELAEKQGELPAAARYFRALAKAVPDRRTAFARLCRVYDAMGDWVRAVDACKAALGKPGAMLEDAARLVQLVLTKDGPLTQGEIADLDAVLKHIEGGSQRRLHAQLRCELGTLLKDEERLVKCTADLARLAPRDAKTLSFSFALAVLRSDFERAKGIIQQANEAELPSGAIDRMKQRLVQERDSQTLAGRVKALLWQAKRDPSMLAYAGVALLVFGAALLFVRRTSPAS